MFYRYGVILTNETITFGYGFSKPGGIASKTFSILDGIQKDSIEIGSASWKDNLLTFGGWGIRLGLNGTTAYNAKNGDYIEFVDDKGYKYRFVSDNVKLVASLLRREEVS